MPLLNRRQREGYFIVAGLDFWSSLYAAFSESGGPIPGSSREDCSFRRCGYTPQIMVGIGNMTTFYGSVP